MRSLLLLSGGLDSTYYAHRLHSEGDQLSFLFFDYGQRNFLQEYAAVSFMAMYLKGQLEVIDLKSIISSRSPLTLTNLPIAEYRDLEQAHKELAGRLEPAFVPMRNPLFLTIALNRASIWDFDRVCIGITAEDASMPDCSPEFLEYFKLACSQALASDKPTVESLITMSKKDIILHSLTIRGCYTRFAFTHTSYDKHYPPIRDHASVEREEMFKQIGIPDPLMVRAYSDGLLSLNYFDENAFWYTLLRKFPLGKSAHWSGAMIELEQELKNNLLSSKGDLA